MTTTDPKLIEPALWQRRRLHPLASAPAGSIPRWQECSAREATGHFEREPGYEYRPLYTAAAINEAVQNAGQWQDIATAPRDGTLLDVWANGRRWPCAYWGRKDHFGRAPWGNESWQGTGGNEPTHWMPLPAPPANAHKESQP